ncbi:carbohydrate ABC transporter permease [Blautia liquoris]|uniref:Carbohydrate ABC transporter permease n=1 Tax=Blautia liquoris TaxID=2779518 RepID=A0A7M2RFC4_9FIRM|nr:carbohydrate ABC transporter permease [Blautia liquoris]QOV18674.1 carbohydrate ABC transporter permease [Blautia liquoris]
MNKSKSNIAIKAVCYIFLFVGLLVILYPLFLTVITAFKTPTQSAENFFSLPTGFYLGNFKGVFERGNAASSFANSIKVTVTSVLLIIIIIPMCGYAIARNMEQSKYYSIIYYTLLIGIFVPFQVIMVPLVMYLGRMNLCSITGLIIMHVTLASSQGVYLMVNYVKSVPRDLEEAAYIDGCTTFTGYLKVVLPLIKPMLATILVLNVLWIWNDFQMPLLLLNQSPEMFTLPLFQYNFTGQYSNDYNLAFASFLLSMVPVLVVYACAQKHIISGLTQGAVKS